MDLYSCINFTRIQKCLSRLIINRPKVVYRYLKNLKFYIKKKKHGNGPNHFFRDKIIFLGKFLFYTL